MSYQKVQTAFHTLLSDSISYVTVDLSSIIPNLRGDHLITCSVLCHVPSHSTVGCPRGTYQTVRSGERVFNGEGIKERYPVCRVCPVSSYQDQVASTDCKICPEYYQTRGAGSTSREDCYGNATTIIFPAPYQSHSCVKI